MESIGRQGERMSEESRDEFEEEKCRVDEDHNLDAGAFRPRQFLEETHCETMAATTMRARDCFGDWANRKRGTSGVDVFFCDNR